MEFLKYQHIERLGTTDVQGIEEGLCYVFPKIDGTNSQLWRENGLHAGSRNRELSLDNDNAGFMNWAVEQNNIKEFFENNTSLRLYGEWLVPHTLKTYNENSWRKFYVFDVMLLDKYLSYEEYKPLLDKYNIDYIPPMFKIENPSYDKLIESLEKNNFLIEDGKGSGEGIVIKRYNYKNRFGFTKRAKIVKNEFKLANQKINDVLELKEKLLIEEKIANQYITTSLIEKEKSKIEINNGWNSKMIPRLLNTIYYSIVTEEIWNIVKEYKNPTINFGTLQQHTFRKIKQLCPEIF